MKIKIRIDMYYFTLLLGVALAGRPLCSDVKQHSGFLGSNNLFYWFFESQAAPANAPLILWLGGGPGFSSVASLFMGNGPCTLDLKPNPFSWNRFANVLYLDQPIATGFSQSNSTISTSKEASIAVVSFLASFFAKHPHYRHLPFHIMSESYGGHFVPEIASLLNSQASPVNLTSIAIASPFIDAQIQFPIIKKVLCRSTCPQLEKSAHQCSQAILNCKSPSSCHQSFEVCSLALIKPYMDSGNDLYSIDPSHRATQAMIDLSTKIDSILNSQLVQNTLNISIPFQTYNPAIFSNFIASGDLMTSFTPKLQQVLQRGHHVLLYSGGKDLLSNIQGIDQIAKSLFPKWPKAFSQQTQLTKSKVHRNLQVTTFPSAGHWISTHHPSQVYKLVKHWVRSL